MNSRREVAKTIAEKALMDVHTRGNFTVVIVNWEDFLPGVGVSKRNPTDEYSLATGLDIARGRALKEIIDRVWEKRYNELYEAGWISPGVHGTIGSNGAGSRLAKWMQDCQNGTATEEDFGKDLTPVIKHSEIWKVWGRDES